MAELNDRILTTTRLIPFADQYVDYLHQLWSATKVRLYLWDDRVISRQQAVDVVYGSLHSFATEQFGFWVLEEIASGELAGFAGLRRFGEDHEIDVLYGPGPAFWRKGYATEAARAVLDFGFQVCGQNKFFAGTDQPNQASTRVIERLGMSFDSERIIDGLPALLRAFR